LTSADEIADEAPGLLEVLAQVPDPRKCRGRRFTLVFLLAVAVACVLAGAKNFREIGDQAADLPQELLARPGGRPHPLLREIVAPSEKRIRTLIQELDAGRLDELIGGWLRAWLKRAGWTACCGRSRSTASGCARQRANSRRYGVRHERERPRLVSLITGSSACSTWTASLGRPGRHPRPGSAALGAGCGLVSRAIDRGAGGRDDDVRR
jgi:hypothetical protein